MSVIVRTQKQQGQAVQSFSLPSQNVTAKPSPVVTALSPEAEKAQRLKQLTSDLLALDETERGALIQQLFKADLEHIVKLEQQKGFSQGQATAEQQWQQKQAQLQSEFASQQQALIAELSQTVTTFAQTPAQIQLKDEGILIDIVYSAVLKILEVQLAEGDYVKDIIRQLADEFAGQETLQLCLSKRDLHFLDELNLHSLLPANMKVIEADNLLPGSYRIHIQGGAIESKLEDKLRNFKLLLLDTYNSAPAHAEGTI